MVGRVYRVEKCLSYEPSLLSSYPVLEVTLYNLRMEKFDESLKIPIDTGFEGSLMLLSEDYEFFQIGELPREAWRIYKTLVGPITMRVSRGFMEIDGRLVEVFIEAPLAGRGKRLIGRELINKLVIVLDGPRSECCTSGKSPT